jgi:tetratricopeptide (TPR) repeat protein
MGGKRTRAGQYFYFCVALLISLSGCGLLRDSNGQRELCEALVKGNTLLAQKDFDGSLQAFDEVWSAARAKPPADVALYSKGLVYAHPENPKRDLHKALEVFERTIESYPDRPVAAQARVWIAVLNETEQAKQEVEKSRQDVERSKQEAEKARLAIERSKQEIEKSRLELEKTKQEIEKTKQVIEKSKQVDIEIDEKRRERRR